MLIPEPWNNFTRILSPHFSIVYAISSQIILIFSIKEISVYSIFLNPVIKVKHNMKGLRCRWDRQITDRQILYADNFLLPKWSRFNIIIRKFSFATLCSSLFFIQSGDSTPCLVHSEHTFYSWATSASFWETPVLNKLIDPYKGLPLFSKVLNILLGRQDRLQKGSTLSCCKLICLSVQIHSKPCVFSNLDSYISSLRGNRGEREPWHKGKKCMNNATAL